MVNHGTTLLTNLDSRRLGGNVVSLDGTWRAILDPYQSGYVGLDGNPNPRGWFRDFRPRHRGDRVEYDFDESLPLEVPGDWNTQRPELLYYEGTVWYRRRFEVTTPESGRTFISFGAANHTARVFFDGEELAYHRGGFGPFSVEVTGRIGPGVHSLIVMVENTRARDRVPAMRTDWYNFGGLHRSVEIVRVPTRFVRSAWLTMQADGSLIGEVSVIDDTQGPLESAVVSIPEIHFEREVTPNRPFVVSAEIADRLDRWHPGWARLYDVHFDYGPDRVSEQIGFRTIEVRGTDIIVNDEPVFLRGISLHAEGPSGGRRAAGPDDAETLLGWAEDLGANFVRLGHYQHDEAMLVEADRRGLLVWAELPVYWGIDWNNRTTLANALQQLDELVWRDRNRVSVALWSVANETFPSEARNEFLETLIHRTRALDPTRLVTAALFHLPGGDLHIDDPLGAAVDVIGVNQYHGWYYGEREDIPDLKWSTAFGKPIVFSELGAGAKAGRHGDAGDIWTEEFQAAVYEAQIEMISRQTECGGLSPWILKDFRSPMRTLPGVQDGYNRKGLISEEGERKLAFEVLRSWYETLAARG